MPFTSMGTTGTGSIGDIGYYYIGQTAVIYIALRDLGSGGGSLTNVPTMTCTVYLPDNTSTTTTVTNIGSDGLYRIGYVLTMAGLHTLRWVTGGGLTDSFEQIIVAKKGATG